MKRFAILIFINALFCFHALSNDGSYTLAGNHLIPISDKNIQVKKEILTVKRNDRGIIEVSVYYEFFNNGADKDVVVGFEAFPTFNTGLKYSKDGKHPYMRDFSVQMNGSNLSYQVALVDDTLYKSRERGVINETNFAKAKLKYESGDEEYFEYTFVYHFNAHFKKGLNIIQHNYEYEPGGIAGDHFNFEYVLDAAARWGNGVIEDFTLIIDVGPYQQYGINKTFFQDAIDWKLIGKGYFTQDYKTHDIIQDYCLGVFIERGMVMYQKQNFKPSNNILRVKNT